ncbi:hypothetical protein ABD91_00740 [Lysinibacillus sphaericus]|uniref:helix-turn-helix domain-containing protein n=1 Tax=Lysinibacillus sphaericus TaxID=1421 RepID=UPI0018CDC940|nr:helix-turn-helix transcriptional regulator [Lysinibacillus sphaericus]MBG9689454.1 hypothetical protein [Lysinibacillus sphaericus]
MGVDSRESYRLSDIIGRHLKSYRKVKKLTMEEVSDRTGYSAQAISLCERAKRMPSPDLLLKLSSVYQISEKELFKLREDTIIDTVQTYGEDSPLSIRNEYETIMNSRDNKKNSDEFKQHKDYLSLGDEKFATEEELILAKAFILTIRSMKNKL